MNTKLQIIFLVFILSACATERNQNKEANNQLGVIAAKCIVDSARTLDDGISPADTVAIGIMSKCQKEIDAYDEVRLPSGAGFNIYATTVWNNRHIGWGRQITSIVLETRAEKNKK